MLRSSARGLKTVTKSVTKCATTSSTSHARKFIIDYSRVQCVTLDVTGTLISFRRQVGEVYASAISHCGLRSSSSASEKHDAQRLQACFWGAFCHIHETLPHVGGDEISTREWWKMVVDRTFADAKYHNFNTEDLAKIFDKVYEDYGRADSYNLFPDVKPFLLRARSNGLKLGVISNESERYSEEILPQFGLNEHFDFIVLAKMAKASKPDPAIFKYAVKRSGVAADRILHVGDHRKKDFEGAWNAGLQAVLIDRFGEEKVNGWRREGLPVFKVNLRCALLPSERREVKQSHIREIELWLSQSIN